MSLLCVKTCFFCCSNSIEISANPDDNEDHHKAIKQRISRISHYLQIPRTVINLEKDQNKLSICYNCENISEKLNELCSSLDLIQLQINYNLHLLTERIKTPPANPVTLSNSQKIFQQKSKYTIHFYTRSHTNHFIFYNFIYLLLNRFVGSSKVFQT